MFFKNELNMALKRISELETEIKSLKEDTVSKKEFSKLQSRFSKAEETIQILSENKSEAKAETNSGKTTVAVQPTENKKAVTKKKESVKTYEAEPVKPVSVKDFVANYKKPDCGPFRYADYKDGIEITKYIGLNRTEVDIPAYIDEKPVIRIGDNAFENAEELEKITFPETLVEIGRRAFASTGLRNFYANSELKLIDASAFFLCKNLQTAIIPDRIIEIKPSTFGYCEKLNYVKFSSRLTIIGEKAFYGCKALRAVNFPPTLRRVEDEAFFDTMIYKIVFPQNVEFIGSCAIAKSPKHIAFLSADTEIKDRFYLNEAVYCIPGGKTYDCLREHGENIRPLEEFPE